MAGVLSLYIDDSGTRNPDKDLGKLPAHGRDWFALGGVMVLDSDRPAVETAHDEFCERWGVSGPLHSSEIRATSGVFRFLKDLSKPEQNRFHEELGSLVTRRELTATACVVDRPGYNARYRGVYGRKRWSLCKTAFHVVVERAAKFAIAQDCRLRVFVERADKITDAHMRSYYEELRDAGQPFHQGRSAKYAPLTAEDFQRVLYEFRTKDKTSRLMQLADLALWPVCIGGYDPENRAYRAMRAAGVLVDDKVDPTRVDVEGIKYSCWDLVKPLRGTG